MFLALISMIFIQFIPLYELGNQKKPRKNELTRFI